MLSPVQWTENQIRIIDQRRLPSEEVWVSMGSVEEVAQAILDLAVRGAPAIGIAAAMGCALAATLYQGDDPAALRQAVLSAADRLSQTRPTAVNLFWALDRMRRKSEQLQNEDVPNTRLALIAEATAILDEDIRSCRSIGDHGATLLPSKANVLTHCNAGALATGGYGTALGIIRSAVEQGKDIHVYADETRPLLQGSRLTTWELMKDGIPVTLICDNMAGSLMRQGKIDACIVGADRITANADAANKIGTYSVAVLARRHGIPFYVAAPFSTVDFSLPSGEAIPIEERSSAEVTSFLGKPSAPAGVSVFNPSFDVTPSALIQAIVTERGVASSPNLAQELRRLASSP